MNPVNPPFFSNCGYLLRGEFIPGRRHQEHRECSKDRFMTAGGGAGAGGGEGRESRWSVDAGLENAAHKLFGWF